MNKPRVWFSVSCLVTLASCAGEPFRAAPAEDEPPPAGATLPAFHTVGPPSLAGVPKAELAFARKGQSQVAAFDPVSGAVRSTTVVGEVVLDLVRDGDRLLVATSTEQLDASEIRAFRVTEGKLELLGESEPLGPGARVFPFPPHTLVLTEDMAVTWSLLDAELALVPSSKAVARPASLVLTRAQGRSRLLALSRTGLEAGQYFDMLIEADFESGWQLDLHSVPAPGRPSSRLGRAPDRDEVYLVRKQADEDSLEVGELSATEPAPPKSFRKVPVPGGIGSIEAVEVDPEREALLVLLSREASTAALVVVPLREGVAPQLVPLAAPVEASEWFSRVLSLSASGRVLVATASGLEAFELGGDPAAPLLVIDTDFDGAGLAAPLVGAED